jgi:hypothetical protein
MIHPEVEDAAIIRRRGSLHGTSAVGHDTATFDSFRSPNLVSGQSSSKCGTGVGAASDNTIHAL